jgi:hypothetical protein
MTIRMMYPKIILPVFEAFNFLADATQISKAQILRRLNHGLCSICAEISVKSARKLKSAGIPTGGTTGG